MRAGGWWVEVEGGEWCLVRTIEKWPIERKFSCGRLIGCWKGTPKRDGGLHVELVTE